jgi:hypothetical protein
VLELGTRCRVRFLEFIRQALKFGLILEEVEADNAQAPSCCLCSCHNKSSAFLTEPVQFLLPFWKFAHHNVVENGWDRLGFVFIYVLHDVLDLFFTPLVQSC